MPELDQDKHHGFELVGNGFVDSDNMNTCYRVHAYRKLDTDEIQSFSEKVSFTEEYVLFNLKNQNPMPALKAKTFSRAKARIDLGLFEYNLSGKAKTYEEVILTTTPPPATKPDNAVQRYILSALNLVRRSQPDKFKIEKLEVEGFCDLIGISVNQYLFNAELLLEKGFVHEGELDQLEVKNGGIYITASGLEHLELIKRMGAGNFEKKQEESGQPFEYDIVISYASEDSEIVDEIAKAIRTQGYKVFYDKFDDIKVALWGTNLYDYLAEIYSRRGRYCMIFVSERYANKTWTNHERQHAQERALKEKGGYILPVKLDSTDLPGLPNTVGYIDKRTTSNEEIVQMVISKLASH